MILTGDTWIGPPEVVDNLPGPARPSVQHLDTGEAAANNIYTIIRHAVSGYDERSRFFNVSCTVSG